MNYLPTYTSRLVVQHPCQVSFKSMQGCRRSWEGKLKFVKILSVKDHNSAKICRTWIISPHALLDLWSNIPAKFHSNPCKDVGGKQLLLSFDIILVHFSTFAENFCWYYLLVIRFMTDLLRKYRGSVVTMFTTDPLHFRSRLVINLITILLHQWPISWRILHD